MKLFEAMNDFKVKTILGALEKFNGNKTHAAQSLGITRRHFMKLEVQLGIREKMPVFGSQAWIDEKKKEQLNGK